jgi:O-antigen/teichoic acid export membrane protein
VSNMSGANASASTRSQEEMSGANASASTRSQEEMSGANASPTGRSHQEMSTGSTFKPALLLTSGRVVAFLFTFFIPVVLVRVFDPGDFGTYKQLFLIYTTIFYAAQFGMAESLYYFMPLNPAQSSRYVVNSIVALAVAGVICLGLIAAGGFQLSRMLNNDALSKYALSLGIYTLLMLVSAALEIAMIARKHYLWASATYAASDTLRAILIVLPVLFFKRLDWLMIGAGMYALTRCVALIVYLRNDFKGEMRVDWACFRNQLRYAIPFGFAIVVGILQTNLHQYAVSHYFDVATFAIYSVGCLQIPIVDFIITPASSVMMVRMSEQIGQGRSEGLIAMWHDMSRKLALMFVPLVALLLLNAHNIIVLLFTERYLRSVPIFMVWSTAIVFATLPTDAMLRVFAQTRLLLILNIISLALIAFGIRWFLFRFDLIGAVLITVLTAALSKVLALLKVKSLLRVPLRDLLPWSSLTRILIAASAASIPAMIVQNQLQLPVLAVLPITGVVYSSIFLVLILLLGALTEDEVLSLTGWVQRNQPRMTRITRT